MRDVWVGAVRWSRTYRGDVAVLHEMVLWCFRRCFYRLMAPTKIFAESDGYHQVKKVLSRARAPEQPVSLLAGRQGRLFCGTSGLCRCRFNTTNTQELSDAIKRLNTDALYIDQIVY